MWDRISDDIYYLIYEYLSFIDIVHHVYPA